MSLKTVDVLSALGHEHRLAVVRLLVHVGEGGLSAGDIARQIHVLPSTLSTHLALLEHARLIRSYREGRSIIYSADDTTMRGLLDFLAVDCCASHSEPYMLPAVTVPAEVVETISVDDPHVEDAYAEDVHVEDIHVEDVHVGTTSVPAPTPTPILPPVDMVRRVLAELIGTMLLLAIVVGSGIMGARLAAGNDALALLGNTLATGAGLIVLIQMFAPLSGAHFNPAVTLALLLRGETDRRSAMAYAVAQFAGAVLGVWVAHGMFAEPLWQVSAKLRSGPALAFAEGVATFGLIGTILATRRNRPEFTPMAVGLYITAAYWFTASTSFANPAVTIARSLSNSFAGIAPASVPMFIAGQLMGTLMAVGFFTWLFRRAPANGGHAICSD